MLYQPLGGEADAGQGTNPLGFAVGLCKTSSEELCAHDAHWIKAARVRGFRLACTGAAVVAIACGGDDLQKEVQEQTQPVRSEYVGVQRPSGDDVAAGEGDDDLDPFDIIP